MVKEEDIEIYKLKCDFIKVFYSFNLSVNYLLSNEI